MSDIAAAKAEPLKAGTALLKHWTELMPSYLNAIVIEIVDEDLKLVLTIPCTDITLQKVPTN